MILSFLQQHDEPIDFLGAEELVFHLKAGEQ